MKKKILIIMFILLIIILGVLLFIVIRKNIVVKNFNNVLDMWRESENVQYYEEIEHFDKEIEKVEISYLNGVNVYKRIKNDEDYNEYKYLNEFRKITLDNINKVMLEENLEENEDKIFIKEIFSGRSSYIFNYLYNNDVFLEKIDYVKLIDFNGRKCYELGHNIEKIYIDKETYYPIAIQYRANQPIYYCELKFDSLTPEDITLPDLTEYTITKKK